MKVRKSLAVGRGGRQGVDHTRCQTIVFRTARAIDLILSANSDSDEYVVSACNESIFRPFCRDVGAITWQPAVICPRMAANSEVGGGCCKGEHGKKVEQSRIGSRAVSRRGRIMRVFQFSPGFTSSHPTFRRSATTQRLAFDTARDLAPGGRAWGFNDIKARRRIDDGCVHLAPKSTAIG